MLRELPDDWVIGDIPFPKLKKWITPLVTINTYILPVKKLFNNKVISNKPRILKKTNTIDVYMKSYKLNGFIEDMTYVSWDGKKIIGKRIYQCGNEYYHKIDQGRYVLSKRKTFHGKVGIINYSLYNTNFNIRLRPHYNDSSLHICERCEKIVSMFYRKEHVFSHIKDKNALAPGRERSFMNIVKASKNKGK